MPRALLVALVTLCVATACTPDRPTPGLAGGPSSEAAGSRSAVDALAARADAPPDPRFARVTGPRPFVFPADHAAHPDYQTEWWYVTANLETAEGRRFGLQWTIFRRALEPPPDIDETTPGSGAPRASSWGTRQLSMGHFALTDPDGFGHRAAERYARAAAGLSGARAEPFRVWLESWSLESVETEDAERPSVDPILPLRLRADDVLDDRLVTVDLVLRSDQPPVLQGDRGFSRKGALPGSASYYYSFTRLEARGTITIDGTRHAVDGGAWLDHEWSTSVLSPQQTGWDWLSLQLDVEGAQASADGTAPWELMLFELRTRPPAPGEPPGVDPASSGTLVRPDGTTRPLAIDDFTLDVLDRWRSPTSGIEYPSRWRLRLPPTDGSPSGDVPAVDLEIVPILADQEMDISFRYWEGAVDVTGTVGDRPTTGRGYVELVGYGDHDPSR